MGVVNDCDQFDGRMWHETRDGYPGWAASFDPYKMRSSKFNPYRTTKNAQGITVSNDTRARTTKCHYYHLIQGSYWYAASIAVCKYIPRVREPLRFTALPGNVSTTRIEVDYVDPPIIIIHILEHEYGAPFNHFATTTGIIEILHSKDRGLKTETNITSGPGFESFAGHIDERNH